MFNLFIELLTCMPLVRVASETLYTSLINLPVSDGQFLNHAVSY